MELVLNLVWVLLAAAIVRLWICHAPNQSVRRRTQFAAMLLLLLVLFPVISVTDDLQAMQNPAESESTLRRANAAVSPHSVFPEVAAVLPSEFTEISLSVLPFAACTLFPGPAIDNPALAPVQNRPPPEA
jgi:hypothetical protein